MLDEGVASSIPFHQSINAKKKTFSKFFANSLLTNDDYDNVWRRTCVCAGPRSLGISEWDAFIHVHCAHTKFNRQSYIEKVSDNFFWETILSLAVATFFAPSNPASMVSHEAASL